MPVTQPDPTTKSQTPNPNYKNTKLGPLPVEWEVVRLEEITEKSRKIGYGVVQTGPNVVSGVPCLRVVDLTDDQIDIERLITTSQEISDSYKRTLLKNKDLVIALRGKIGQLKVVAGDLVGCNLTRGVALIPPNHSKANSHFLKCFLSSPKGKRNFEMRMSGSALKEISIKVLRRFPIPLPPLPEQKAIATCLATWDRAITTTRQLLTALRQRKKGLMQELLTGRRRLPGFTGEWEEYRYSDLLKEVKRKLDWDDDELYQLISVRRRSGGIFERDALFGYQIKTKTLRPAKAGDFLISKMQIVHGASALTTDEFDDMKISSSYLALRAKHPHQIDMRYFDWHSRLPYFYHQTYIASYGVHIEKMTFNFKSFLKLKMDLPPIDEQRAIVKVLTTADREIQLYEQKLARLEEQKKGLMQQLLTGRKRLV